MLKSALRMAAMNKCAACGFESDNFPDSICPQCGKKLPASAPSSPLILAFAFLQAALITGFLLAFHFPRPLIAFAAPASFIVTLLASRLRRAAPVAQPRMRRAQPSQPLAVRLIDLAIAFCGVTFVLCLLFGFVIFMNSRDAWQRMQGQPYHATTFQVTSVYYQKYYEATSRTLRAHVFASGIVEGKKEWMDLLPYLRTTPHDRYELEDLVPRGTVIPVYLFPSLSGQARVQLIGPIPPAEANYDQATWVLKHGLIALGILALFIFVLVLIRRACRPSAFRAHAAGA
jgi:hypothetical protein